MKRLGFVLMFILMISAASAFDWSNNLTAYYDFNESSGTNAPNIVDGTYNYTFDSDMGVGNWVTGLLSGDNALDFDGVAEHATSGDLDMEGNYSISVWINPDTNPASGVRVLYKSNTTGYANYDLLIVPGPEILWRPLESDVTAHDINVGGVQTAQWTHTVLTANGTHYAVYVNGTLKDVTSYDGTIFTNDGSGSIGARDRAAAEDDWYDGQLDELGFWNRTLSSTEVTELYNGGNGLAYGIEAANIILQDPSNDSSFSGGAISFNVTYDLPPSSTDNWTNTSYFFWYPNGTLYNESSGISLSGVEDSSNFTKGSFPIGYMHWNVYACTDGVTCHTAENNNTFYIGINTVNETYPVITSETLTEEYEIFFYVPDGTQLDSSNLIWNSTGYASSVDSLGSGLYGVSKTLTMPEVTSQTNVSWYWNFNLNNSQQINTSARDTQINTLAIDNCAVNTHEILNYTIHAEDNRAFLDNSTYNTSAEVYVQLSGDFTGNTYTYFAASLTTNPITICASEALLAGEDYRLDSQIKFSADPYVTEYHHIVNFSINDTIAPLQINLYDLLTTESQEFLITYKDANFIPVEGAIIDITRQYLDLGQFLSVEVVKTDSDGRAIGHFVLNEEVYTIYVKVNGTLVATFENVQAFCDDVSTGDCRINLGATGSTTTLSSFINNKGVSYTHGYNDTSKKYTFTFTTTDGSTKSLSLNATKYDNYFNDTICTSTILGSSGTLSCTVPAAYYNESMVVEIYVEGELLSTSIVSIGGETIEFGNAKYLFAFFLIITLPLLALGSGAMTIIMFIVGLVLAAGMALIDLGGFIGPLSAFLWFVVAALIILWKVTREEKDG